MKKTIKTDDLVTAMTDLERSQSEAWARSEADGSISLDKQAWKHYAAGVGYCLKRLEELLK